MTRWCPADVPKIEGEFWTHRQRQMHSLHYAISYRASFKPELPDYCIRTFSSRSAVVADPFCGRGTTALQANLLGRHAWVNDVNPLATEITYAKTNPVSLASIEEFIQAVDWQAAWEEEMAADLLAFYHPQTLRELHILRKELACNQSVTARFTRMLALSRLHGHSSGFFSAYSMPQLAVSPQAQRRINSKKGAVPDYRDVPSRILTKAKKVLKDGCLDEIRQAARLNRYSVSDARNLTGWPANAVDLIVTSPPFLNVVDYLADNWLEHWFLDINPQWLSERLVQTPNLSEWQLFMQNVLFEMARVLKRDGFCIIEVGDVRVHSRSVNLEDVLLQIIFEQGKLPLLPVGVLIQKQQFTKLAHCFAVTNNKKGTNTQRLLVLQKR